MDNERRTTPEEDPVLHDVLEDAYFQYMIAQYMEDHGKKLAEQEAQMTDAPKPTRAQMHKLAAALDRERNGGKPSKRRVRRRAVPIAIVAAVLAVMVATASAFKVQLFNFFHVPGSISTEYGTQADDDRKYKFGYIPEELSERFYETNDDTTRVFYVGINDENEYLLATIVENGQPITVDTENAQVIEPIQINNQSGELSQKGGLCSIIWMDESTATTFLLQAPLEREELIKIASELTYR